MSEQNQTKEEAVVIEERAGLTMFGVDELIAQFAFDSVSALEGLYRESGGSMLTEGVCKLLREAIQEEVRKVVVHVFATTARAVAEVHQSPAEPNGMDATMKYRE